MAEYRVDLAITGPQDHHAERDRLQAQHLPTAESHQEGSIGVRQYRQEPLPARLRGLANTAAQRPQGLWIRPQ